MDTVITVPSTTDTPQPPADLIDGARALAEARRVLAEAKTAHDSAKRAYEESAAAVIAAYKAAQAVEKDAKGALDCAAEAYYETTGDKKPIEGVEVKIDTIPTFGHMEARNWCALNMPAMLVLNEDAYAKLLREVKASTVLSALLNLPGEMIERPKAYISHDMAAYLDD